MQLTHTQREVLRSTIHRQVAEVPDDQLIAWAILLGHSLDEIEALSHE